MPSRHLQLLSPTLRTHILQLNRSVIPDNRSYSFNSLFMDRSRLILELFRIYLSQESILGDLLSEVNEMSHLSGRLRIYDPAGRQR